MKKITLIRFSKISTVFILVSLVFPIGKVYSEINSESNISKDIAKMREHIKTNNLPTKFLDRLDEFEKDNTNSTTNLGTAQQVITTEIIDNNNHPFKTDSIAKTINKADINSIIPASLISLDSAESSSGASGMLTPSGFITLQNETKESQSIKDMAIKLGNNPLNILNFVREQIKYQPYYGSKKGAEATLLESEGNDADQSALMIALLRAGDSSGNNKIPARYRHGVVKLTLRNVMDMVGVDNPELAARVLGGRDIPYHLYYDGENPVFFVVEMFWVEAWIEYGEYRGITSSGLTDKKWIPMVPGLVPTYYFRSLDTIGGLISTGFNITTFYEKYLHGDYGTATPIDALEAQVVSYISTQEGKTLKDAKTIGYRGFNKFEFIPRTLPFSIVTDYGNYENIPDILRHKMQFKVTKTNNTFLDHSVFTSDIADGEILITYDPATTDDATFLASFPTIYDVVPLSLLQLKPVLRVSGNIVSGGSGQEINTGTSAILSLNFFAPKRDTTGTIIQIETEQAQKPTTAGNTEAIAIDTGNVMSPELRPSADTQTTSFVKDQKLYRTALNYLDRLEKSHDRLSEFTGGTFTDIASRAIISNSLAITKVNGTPYSFAWKGLSIDSSVYLRYHSRFGVDADRYLKEFTYIFGLESSLDEATIFEQDYGVDAVSTVKALRLINQGIIPGQVIKITSANSSIIDTMNISSQLKTRFYNSVAEGDTIYSPNAPFARGNWNGMVYITLDPITGSGSYTIGEGLNGGYTVEQFSGGWSDFWRTNLLPGLTATIVRPTNNQEFTVGDTIQWKTSYNSPLNSWEENINITTKNADPGTYILKSGYGTDQVVSVVMNGKPKIPGPSTGDFDSWVIEHMNRVGLPPAILKTLISKESTSDPFKIRYEPCLDIQYKASGRYNNIPVNNPYTYYLIGGSVRDGLTFTQGDGIAMLKNVHSKTPQQMIKSFSIGNMILEDINGDGVLSVYEVWERNHTTKNYSQCSSITPTTGNFPAQLIIASSYGLGQMLYTSAIDQGFNKIPGTNTQITPPRDIWDLFSIEIAIKEAADHLKGKFNQVPISGYNQNIPIFACDYAHGPVLDRNKAIKNLYSIEELDALDAELRQVKDKLWWASRWYNGSLESSIVYANEGCALYHKLIGN